jgi:hypothetical protein
VQPLVGGHKALCYGPDRVGAKSSTLSLVKAPLSPGGALCFCHPLALLLVVLLDICAQRAYHLPMITAGVDVGAIRERVAAFLEML